MLGADVWKPTRGTSRTSGGGDVLSDVVTVTSIHKEVGMEQEQKVVVGPTTTATASWAALGWRMAKHVKGKTL